MVKLIKGFVVGCAALGGSCAAFAHGASAPDLPSPQGLSVHVGQFFPTSRTARDFEGGHWFLAGIGYDVSKRYNFFGTGVGTMVSLDYYSKGSFTAVPIMINATSRTGRVFMGAGAGVSFVHRIDSTGSFAETTFGYQVFAGFDFIDGPQPVYLEARFIGNGRPDLAGFGLSVGTRF